MEQQITQFDKIISRFKNNPLTSIVIVLGTIVIALAAFTDAAKNILSLLEGKSQEAARIELGQLRLDYKPDIFVKMVKKGDLYVAKLFLTAGMNPNVKDNKGNTALMYAARAGDITTINFLMDAKANVNERNSGGPTALSWAVSGENIDVVRLLLDRGADAEAINNASVSAASGGRLDILRILLDRGADLKRIGSKALLRAVSSWIAGVTEKERSDTVRFLLELGVDPNAKNEDGWSALLFASDIGYASIVKILLNKGANINAKCDCRGFLGGGWTALMIAIYREHTEIVEALLSKGADVHTSNHYGQTALLLAIDRDNEGLAQALRNKGAMDIVGTLSSKEVFSIIVKHDFYDKRLNPSGKGIEHKYKTKVIGDAVVVMDHTTNLMWQKGGSERQINFDKAEDYIKRLNTERFAGFSDWRLPTMEEAMSLMEPKAYDEFHISPVFQSGVNFIWTAGRKPDGRYLMIYFYDGILATESPQFNAWVRAVRLIANVANE